MRSLIRYDLDEPPPRPAPAAPPTHTRRPPAKKRKRNHNPPKQLSAPAKAHLHWDDPGTTAVGVIYDDQEGPTPLATGSATMTYAADAEEEEGYSEGVVPVQGDDDAETDLEQEEDAGREEEGEEEEEECRPLTHDEIWDDSALIDAWNSAQAEYEAYHGTSTAWKSEPVKKSPLWYNKPYTPPAPQPSPSKPKARSKRVPSHGQEAGEPEPDTAPLDFATYIPTHDPSLGIPSEEVPASSTTNVHAPFFVPPPSTTMISRDEAFNNALSAMYWSGYWTAVYHCQSQTDGKKDALQAEATGNGVEADEGEEDLVPAQR